MRKRIYTFLVSLFLCLTINAQNNVITPELQEMLNRKSDELIDINIYFKSQMPTAQLQSLQYRSDSKEVRREIVINELKKFSQQQQESVMSVINAETRSNNVTDVKSHWLVNSINCKASRDVIYTLASHPDIKHIGYNKEETMFQGEDQELREQGAGSRGSVSSMTDNITHVQAEKVWDLGYTGKGVIVAVIDSGVNLDHVDLKDHLWDGGSEYPYHGYNFVNPGQAPYDDKGHGTHCAGTICGDGTSGLATGIAPDATLMCLKTSSKTETSTTFDRLSSAIEFAVEHGADIISISVGGWINDNVARASFRQIFDNALNLGVITSAAAGNNRQYLTTTLPAPRNINSPSDCPPPWIHPDQQGNGTNVSGVVSVGGVNYENQVISISSQGPTTWQETSYADYPYNPGIGLIRPDIVAPGDGIKSLDYETNDGYAIKSGTSMAAPCVAGVMALMLEKNPELTPADICRIIETTATKLTDTKSNDYGSGCINALAAVQAVNFDVTGSYLKQYSFTKNFEALSSNANQNLEITLVNNGTQATTGTTNVTLTSNDAYVTVVNGNASINNSIAVGGTATCNFTIKINTLSPDNHIAKLTVNAGTSSFNIEINISNEFVAPSNVTTEVQNLRNVYLSWNATNNATGYKIYRDGVYIGETSTTSYTDENLDYGTLYTYTITTKRGELETEHSREIRVQTGDNPEAPSPTNVVATDNNSSVAISWNNSTGSKGSNIYRKDNIAGTETQIASNVSGNSYTDNISLQEGIYQYGVANLHSEKETIYEEGFENNGTSLPEGWSVYRVGASQRNWSVQESETQNSTTFTPYMGQYAAFSFYAVNNYDIKFYLVTSSFDLSEYQGSDVTLSFYYITPAWGTDVNNLNVRIGSSPTGPWNDAIWASNKTDVTEWTKAEVDITSYIGSTFYITFENEIGYGFCSAVDNVSIAIDGNKESRIEWSDNIYKNVNVFAQDGVWNNSSNWETNRIPNANDSHIIINANAVIDGTVEVNSLTINEGKTLTLNEGAILTVNGNFNNTDPNAFIINDGAQVIQSNENVAATFNMNIVNPNEWSSNNKTGWQFISSPVQDAKINDFIPQSSEYDLYKYDGSSDFEWINHKDENNYGGDDEPEVPVISIDTVTIGEGNYSKAYYAPISNYGSAKYSYSQQIYLKEEIGKDNGTITSIAFHNANGGPNDRNIIVYMSNVEKSSYSNSDDYVNVTNADIVYQGYHAFGSAEEWTTIELQTPFVYTGKNIAVTVNDLTGVSKSYSGYDQFYSTITTENRGIYGTSNSSIFDCSNLGDKFLYILKSGAYSTPANTPYVADLRLIIESGNGGGGGQEPEDPETPVTPTVPAAPVVTAEAVSSSSIKLSWDAVAGATSYKVYSVGEVLTETTGTNYTVSYLQSNTSYCFSVSALNENGESAQTEACATTLNAKPITPYDFTATATGESTIELSWSSVNKATSYNVYQGDSKIAEGLTETTYTVEGLEPETEYCFTVTAENEIGESDKSAEACAMTEAEASTIVEIGTNSDGTGYVYLPVYDYSAYSISQQIYTSSEIALGNGTIRSVSFKVGDKGSAATRQYEVYLKNITASSFQENGYEYFELSSSDKVYDGAVAVGGKQEWFTINFTTPFEYTGGNVVLCVYDKTGTSLSSSNYHNFYKYAVSGRSLYNSGYSAYNPTTLATSASGMSTAYVNLIRFGILPSEVVAPAIPSLSAVATSSSEISLTWNLVPGATSYNVYQGDNQIATGLTETTFNVEGLEAETEYCFTVTAVNTAGESAKSGAECVTTEAEAIPCTIEFILGDQYSDTWNGNSLEISYNGTTESFVMTNGKATETFTRTIEKGTSVSVRYVKGSAQYTYPSENSFTIQYEGGEVIFSQAQGSLSKTTDIGTFVVDCTPKAPNAPELTAKATGPTAVVLTWNPVFGAESYSVYKNGVIENTELRETTYTVEGLTALTEYCFTVTAVNEIGESEESNEECVTTKSEDSGDISEIQIGLESGLSTSYSPVYDYYKSYSVSQTIYTSNEIGVTSGTITSISYKNNSGNNNTRNIAVYLKNVDRNNFATKEWETLTSDLCVYDGSFTFGTNDWVTIEFTDEFEYDGGNLLVCVVDKTGSAIYSSYDTFSAYEVSQTESESRAVYGEYKSYGTPINPLDLANTASTPTYVRTSLGGTTYSYRAPLVKFEIEVNTNANSRSATREVSSVSPSRGVFESAFQQGVGYLASYESENTAVFQGNINHQNSYEFNVSYNADKNFANFHLLGNPFTFNMEWNKVATNNLADGYAVVNASGGYDYFSDGEIKVGDGFFVKSIGENPSISYNKRNANRSNTNPAIINVIASGKAGNDNVIIKIDEEREGFPKLNNFNENIAKIFVQNNDKRYGVHNVNKDTEEVELAFEADAMGNYSIIINHNNKFDKLILVDKEEDTEYDMLLNNEYKFFSTVKSSSRFVVKFSLKDGVDDDENFAFQAGNELIINAEGKVQIFDVLGRMVYNNDVENANHRIDVSNFNNATYIVRCISDKNVRTQKVVIL